MKSVLSRITMSIIALGLAAQFSQQQSGEGKDKPKINFSGTLVDQTGHSYQVENITLSGMYRSIPFYKKPRKASTSPETNTTRIDLKETSEIRVPYRDDAPIISNFKNRDYIEVEVILNDQTKNGYIIERSRKIFCDEMTAAGPVEKEISFEALDKISITGHKEREMQRSKKNGAH